MKLVKWIKKCVFNLITFMYKIIYKHIKVDEKTIIFISYHGKGYLCNPKYIHKELLKDSRFKDFKFIYPLKNKNEVIDGAKVIRYRGLKFFYYLAKSKYWVVNCKLPSYCLKKDNQVYIQTWHGTPLKRLAHDIEVKDDTTFYRSKMSRDEMTKTYDIDVEKYDYLISPNPYSSEIFESCFKINRDKIKEYGYPRNDYLVNITDEEIEALKVKYNIPKNKKVILYAPTWRDNKFNEKGYVHELKVNFEKWEKKLSDEYVVIFKPHYLISNKFNDINLEGFLFKIDEDVDINELYVMSDLLVTDYSSVFFDYSILNRPILFYMYDLDEYRDELRGFYLDINKDLPGRITTKEEELLDIIKNRKYDEYKEKLSEFKNKYNSLEKGNASKQIIDELILN
ncbi:CDP-glycerol glycerophosphotransferase family protein [Terrisporobacter sp.]